MGETDKMMQEEAAWLAMVKKITLGYRVEMPGGDNEDRPDRGTPEYEKDLEEYRKFRDNLLSRLYRNGEELDCDGYFLSDCTPMLLKCLEDIHLPILQTFSREFDFSLNIGIFCNTIGGRVQPVFIHRDFLLKEELKSLEVAISDYPTHDMDEHDIVGFLETFPNVSHRIFPISKKEIKTWDWKQQFFLRLRKGQWGGEEVGGEAVENKGEIVFQYAGEVGLLGASLDPCVKTWLPQIEADFRVDREKIERHPGEWRVECHVLFTSYYGTCNFHAESCLRPILDLLNASGVFIYFEPMWIDRKNREALQVTEKNPSEISVAALQNDRKKRKDDENLAMVREMGFTVLAEMPGYDREEHEEPTEEYDQFLKELRVRLHPDHPHGFSESIFLTDCSEVLPEFLGLLDIPALVEVAHEYDSWINLSVYSETVGARVQPVFIPREFFYRSELDGIEIALENCESYDLKRQAFRDCIEADPNVCVHLSPLPMAEIEEWADCEGQHSLYLKKTRSGLNEKDANSPDENGGIGFHYSGEIMQQSDDCVESWIPKIKEDLNANRERLEKQEGEWRVECHVAFTTPDGFCSFYAKSSFRPILNLLDAPGVFFYFEPMWLDRENQQALRVTCKPKNSG